MLVRFTVENYLSIRDPVELSLVASRDVNDEKHVVRGANSGLVPLLKLAVIYGANASGKSNIVKAMSAGKNIIMRPEEAGRSLEIRPFKIEKEFTRRPSRFGYEIMTKGKMFAYGFVASQEKIEEEWLYRVNKEGQEPVFERKRQKVEFSGLNFDEEEHEQFLQFTAKGTLPNRLFLTECRERNVKTNVPEASELFDVLDWFENSLTLIFPHSKFAGLILHVHQNPNFKKELARYLRYFDTGIEEIGLEKEDFNLVKLRSEDKRFVLESLDEGHGILIPDTEASHWLIEKEKGGEVVAYRLVARHSKRNGGVPVTFDIKEESDGTRRLMDLVPAMMMLLDSNRVFVIDELDRSLHPDISHSYIANFLRHSKGRESQLILTTHETTLMTPDLLRKDEIWLVEKGLDQSTKLSALEEYKGSQMRNAQKDYLQGRFGAVPVISNFDWLECDNGEGVQKI